MELLDTGLVSLMTDKQFSPYYFQKACEKNDDLLLPHVNPEHGLLYAAEHLSVDVVKRLLHHEHVDPTLDNILQTVFRNQWQQSRVAREKFSKMVVQTRCLCRMTC